MDGARCITHTRENVADTTAATTAARKVAHPLRTARAERWRELLASKHVIDVAIEAPLASAPALTRRGA